MMEPKIRFKGFDSRLDKSLIGDICHISTGKSNTQDKKDDGIYPFYVRSPHIERSNKYLYDEEAVLTVGDGVGTGKVFHYVNGKYDLHQRVYRMFNFKDINAKYFYYLFSQKFYKRVMSMTAKSSVDSVRLEMISQMEIEYPSINEQETIANYFTSLDSQISASTSRLAALKQMKAASLQAMFPQEGETVPKIRFKGFEGEWKKVSFKDFTFHAGTKNRDNLPLESYSISNEFGFIPQNEQFENGGTMTQADKRMYYIVSPNSFAYNPARINVGSLGYYEGKEDVIVSSLYEVFKTDDTICDKFLLYWFKTDIFQKMIEQFQEGGVRLYFFYDKMCKCSLMRPPLAEQQVIANYFTSLDRQISLQSQRLEKLKQIKSACLDKMFV